MSDILVTRAFVSAYVLLAFLIGTMCGVCLSVWVDRHDARAMTERMERLVERENKVRWLEEEMRRRATKKERRQTQRQAE